MPILDIEVIIKPGQSLTAGLTQELADFAGRVFDTPRGHTWVRLRALPREQYAENGGALPDDIQAVFVTVLKSQVPAPGRLKAEISRLCAGIARICKRAQENVHILYLPEAAGRMSFGGQLVPPNQALEPTGARLRKSNSARGSALR